MMASPINAAICALAGAAFWSVLGYAILRRLVARSLAAGLAPVVGWAAHSAATLPIFTLTGFSRSAVLIVVLLCAIAGGASLWWRAVNEDKHGPSVPIWTYAAAAALALVPAVALLPKMSADSVHVADPIFDHAKVAIVDAMVRQGLPPIDPVVGSGDASGHLFYYYLWHYSAAELALLLHFNGWEADIALTWFTAFASLSAMMGLAVWFANREGAAGWVVVLAAAASLRQVLSATLGTHSLETFLTAPTGFAGWLFQAAWAPQHLMAGTCVVAAMLLIARFARQQSLVLLPVLILVVAAGFESSTYVGGIVFAIAALAAFPILFAYVPSGRRLPLFAGLAAAALLSLSLAAPLIFDQITAVAGRGGGSPVDIHPFPVLGVLFPDWLRHVLDLPAYWLILLPIELPATYLAGALALFAMMRSDGDRRDRMAIGALCCVVGAGLGGSWLLASRVGFNNDLGLRAVVPAFIVLIAAAAAGVMLRPRRTLIVAAAISGLALSLPDTVQMIRSNVEGRAVADGDVFAQAPALWQAVRRYARPFDRVGNNPLFLSDLTPWPVNLSWALLANRSSCFAGSEMALAFAPWPPDRRDAAAALFARVFAGRGAPGDVSAIAEIYGCQVIVVVPQDGAWRDDPFAISADYRLAESRANHWRIYVRATRPAAAN